MSDQPRTRAQRCRSERRRPRGLPAQGALRRRRRAQRHQHPGRARCRSWACTCPSRRWSPTRPTPRASASRSGSSTSTTGSLKEAGVQVSDSRPDAWFETGRVCTREPERIRAAEWLERHFAEPRNTELVVKDPRLSWFLGLWRVAAVRTGARRSSRPCCARRPRWSAASRSTTPTGSAPRTSRPAGSTCCSTPSAPPASPSPTAAGSSSATTTCSTTGCGSSCSVGRAARASRRHARPQRADPRRAPLRRPQPAPVSQSLDDLGLPPRLHDLTGETWERAQQARRARTATPPPRTRPRPAPRGLRRPLRGGRGDLALLGRRGRAAQPARQLKGGGRSADRRRPRRAADKVPHGVRAAIPPPMRRGVRKALGPQPVTADDGAHRRGRDHQPRGPRRLRHHLAVAARRAACARARPPCCG